MQPENIPAKQARELPRPNTGTASHQEPLRTSGSENESQQRTQGTTHRQGACGSTGHQRSEKPTDPDPAHSDPAQKTARTLREKGRAAHKPSSRKKTRKKATSYAGRDRKLDISHPKTTKQGSPSATAEDHLPAEHTGRSSGGGDCFNSPLRTPQN